MKITDSNGSSIEVKPAEFGQVEITAARPDTAARGQTVETSITVDQVTAKTISKAIDEIAKQQEKG